MDIITESKNQTYGGVKQKAKVYTIKKGSLVFCCVASWHTASYMGERHEVFQELMKQGFIPKKYQKSSIAPWRSGGYFDGVVCEKYSIESM